MNWSIEQIALELESPLETAAGRIEDRSGWLLCVRSDGHAGVGTALPLPGWTESEETCKHALEESLTALSDVDSPGAARDVVESIDAPAARHALSLAVLDLEGHMRDLPVASLLADDDVRWSVPVNATVGDCSPERTRERVRAAIDDGYRIVKCKVGARSLEQDRKRIGAARVAAGDSTRIRVDANEAWTRSSAEQALEWLADEGVQYLEQPLDRGDLRGHYALRDSGVPIALDESLSEHPVDAILEADACDVLVLKPMALGGIDRTVEIARRARSRGVSPVVTTTVDDVVATAGAVHAAGAIAPEYACGLGTLSLLSTTLVDGDPLPVDGGHIDVPEGPGLGVTPGTIDR